MARPSIPTGPAGSLMILQGPEARIVQGNGRLPWAMESSFSGMITAVMAMEFMLYVKRKNI